MAETAGSKFVTQAEFARLRGVTRKAVTGWKIKGLLVLAEDGRVDVDQSEWNLDQRPATYRGGVTHRPVRGPDGNNSSGPAPKAGRVPFGKKEDPAPRPSSLPQDGEDEGDEPLNLDAPNLPLAEAVRRKENFLGLQRKQQFQQGEKALVDRGAARKLFFETARDNRDAWLAWPARVGVTMADELKIEARTLTNILTAHVQQHLAELGEPHADL